ncbi:MAG TPA: S8 family serine peptidase [Gemmatimonadaceae bacterium]|nr:S8 family serine peptidase [Gemmatimonadaceae bacterium]
MVIEARAGSAAALDARIAALGGRVEQKLPQLNVVVVRGLTAAGIASLQARPEVAHLTKDVKLRWIPTNTLQRASTRAAVAKRPSASTVDQSGAFFFDTFQWNMKVTKANQAWLFTPEGKGAKVYVLDTGIDATHQDLAGLVDLENSASFAEAELGDIKDYESHGTFVASIITSNGLGVASVAPLARITAVKVLDASGSGSFADLITGIVYAADKGADVINMSLGAIVDTSDKETRTLVFHLQAAINYARSRGVVIVAASGNEALDLTGIPPQIISIPAELPGVISVGATAPVNQMSFDKLASYSNFGWTGTSFGGVPLVAPGGDLVEGGALQDLIISACSQFSPFACGPQDYLIGAGTSFASPMVAGESAVLRSIVGKSLGASLINYDCVLRGADPVGPSSQYGRGRMNVIKASECARRGAEPARTLIAQSN